jgi:hypothetical protein
LHGAGAPFEAPHVLTPRAVRALERRPHSLLDSKIYDCDPEDYDGTRKTCR